MIYLHVPFCESRCTYCGFFSSVIQRNSRDLCYEAYADAVCKEISERRDEIAGTLNVNTLYIGGGTPSVLPLDVLSRIVHFLEAAIIRPGRGYAAEPFALRASSRLACGEPPVHEATGGHRFGWHTPSGAGDYSWEEFTIEVNPEDIVEKGEEYVKGLLALGVNRVSMGVQSFDDEILKWMNRRHDSATAVEAFRILRRCGVGNISIDLIFGLPRLSEELWSETIGKALELEPEHISAYSLIVEEGTPFFEMDLDLPGEDEDRLMYHETKRIFKEHGYHRYEISNYARSAIYECRHNKVYWKRGNYLGVGLGASSMVENTRWSNVCDIHKYIELSGSDGIRENLQRLTTNAQMEEFMFLGLRLVEGISVKDFEREFGRDIFGVYGDVIDRYKRSGHLRLEKDMLSLTDEGLDVSNTVMADFLLDDG